MATIEQALADHLVLVMPKQHLDPAAMVAFSRLLGPPRQGHASDRLASLRCKGWGLISRLAYEKTIKSSASVDERFLASNCMATFHHENSIVPPHIVTFAFKKMNRQQILRCE